MAKYNLPLSESIENTYSLGMLPQRNKKGLFYFDSSCRSDLSSFSTSSENRRILRKTDHFSYSVLDIKDFPYTRDIQKTITQWIAELGWEFPTSSVKTVFTNHIFNQVIVWSLDDKTVAYSLCFLNKNISHIAYVFYDPKFSHSDLPIRLVLQFIIDSHVNGLKYCYLGRFSQDVGFYKRNMPGFEYYKDNKWIKY